MKAALIYPPTCDPTAPYIAVPLLTACLRARGVEVLPIDANLGAWRHLLEPEALRCLLKRVRGRFLALDRQPSLGHAQQLEYAVLAEACRGGAALPQRIRGALALLGGGQGAQFYQDAKYGQAVAAVEQAQALIGAAYHPLSVSFAEYRTPFSLLTAREIAREARPESDPFHDYYAGHLIPRLRAEQPELIGLSVVFPGQLQPAFSLARLLRSSFPGAHLTAGGPALTQFLLRVPPERTSEALGPLGTAVLFEGEQVLGELCDAVARGEAPSGVLRGRLLTDLAALPAPDFDGLPLSEYLAPEPVLPYDAARGCYWGRCAFCHYGLAEKGTAPYRERPVERVAEHLLALSAKHGCRLFYLSEDTIAPAWLLRLAGLLAEAGGEKGSPIRWATDLRAERGFSERQGALLRRGGALAVSVGVESGSARVLSLMGKGLEARGMKAAVRGLSRAGLAVEVMCFYDFPSETHGEAMESLALLEELEESTALFMYGPFKLTAGSRVAERPEDYGIAELWRPGGDELHTSLFFSLREEPKRPEQRRRFEAALQRLSERFRLRRYPWAGSLSTAHTLLWYDRHGPDAFRRLARQREGRLGMPHGRPLRAFNPGRYPLASLTRNAWRREEEVWDTLVFRLREVTRAAYGRQALAVPALYPRPATARPRASRGAKGRSGTAP
jgi:anaerobic magnesium-protoporphyrin IX monomethyl ester cyclase